MRRLVRLGGASLASVRPAARLMQLLCRADWSRSQDMIHCMRGRMEESLDARALQSTLRMASALVDLDDVYTQQRCVFLLRSVLQIAKSARACVGAMHVLLHYIVKWCFRRISLPQWFVQADGSGGVRQHKWIEAWLREMAGSGGWTAASLAGLHKLGGPGSSEPSPNRGTGWCSEHLPFVHKLLRGEPVTKSPLSEAVDSEGVVEGVPPEMTTTPASRRGSVPKGRVTPGARASMCPSLRAPLQPKLRVPVLSKMGVVNAWVSSIEHRHRR